MHSVGVSAVSACEHFKPPRCFGGAPARRPGHGARAAISEARGLSGACTNSASSSQYMLTPVKSLSVALASSATFSTCERLGASGGEAAAGGPLQGGPLHARVHCRVRWPAAPQSRSAGAVAPQAGGPLQGGALQARVVVPPCDNITCTRSCIGRALPWDALYVSALQAPFPAHRPLYWTSQRALQASCPGYLSGVQTQPAGHMRKLHAALLSCATCTCAEPPPLLQGHRAIGIPEQQVHGQPEGCGWSPCPARSQR